MRNLGLRRLYLLLNIRKRTGRLCYDYRLCLGTSAALFLDVLKALKGFQNPNPKEKKIPAYTDVEKLGKIFQIETWLWEFTAEERLRIRKEK